ncbi:helix-turn-helix domain-containing protein [Salibacterium lacus]|uniref:Helix-turn-helix domain-containing protein n=1 Tax=Salibacterium lacus TaxID=1898109 RepID=A0ABW5SY05_9BACI
MNKQDFPLVMGTKDVQEVLGVGYTKAKEVMRQRDVPSFRVGRYNKIYREDFFAWLENQKEESPCM